MVPKLTAVAAGEVGAGDGHRGAAGRRARGRADGGDGRERA